MFEAIKFAHEHIKKQCEAQEKLAKAFGKKETREYDPEEEDEDLMKKVHEITYNKCYEVAKKGLSKSERGIAFDTVKEELLSTFIEEELEEQEDLIKKYFYKS